MTFDEILVQVLELLQREKRPSYRALLAPTRPPISPKRS
jgi:hypothetical protein